LIPTLALGIPGSSTSAVILAALMSYGLTPGPNLFSESDLVWGIFGGYLLANILMVFVGLLAAWVVVKILNIPRPILNWSIFILCVVGTFGVNGNLIDVWMMFIFGLIGYAMEKYGFPLVPLILGIILGPLAESSFYKTMIIYDSPWYLLARPIAGPLLILAVLSFVFPIVRDIVKARRKKAFV
jgi:putative tricarboxylic transport membrane protein